VGVRSCIISLKIGPLNNNVISFLTIWMRMSRLFESFPTSINAIAQCLQENGFRSDCQLASEKGVKLVFSNHNVMDSQTSFSPYTTWIHNISGVITFWHRYSQRYYNHWLWQVRSSVAWRLARGLRRLFKMAREKLANQVLMKRNKSLEEIRDDIV